MTLELADADSLADLGRYAARAKRLDEDGGIRLQAVGSVLAAWVCARPGTGLLGEGVVLALRTFALAEAAEVDVTVPLAAVGDRVHRRGAGRSFPLPPTTLSPSWTALTPPRGGWEHVGVAEGDGLVEMAQGRRERLAAQTAAGPLVLQRVVGVAAYGLGFLTPGCEVSVHRSGAWTRLGAPGGYVLTR